MASEYAINAGKAIAQSNGLLANKIVGLLVNTAYKKYAINNDEGQAAYARIRDLTLSDVKFTIDGQTFDAGELMDSIEDHVTNVFDSAVASAVKDVVYRNALEKLEDSLNSVREKISEAEQTMNYEVGHAIQKTFGVNTGWTESTGTC